MAKFDPRDFGGIPLPEGFGGTSATKMLHEIVMPWLNLCSSYMRSVDGMEKHMSEAARLYDILDLTTVMTAEYRVQAIRAIEITCTHGETTAEKTKVIKELDRLAKTTALWPASWPKWVVKHYLRISVLVPIREMETMWPLTVRRLKEWKRPEWMITNVDEVVGNPVLMIKHLLDNEHGVDPEDMTFYTKCCKSWHNLVKEGMSEDEAGNLTMVLFRERKMPDVPKKDIEADIRALIGDVPPDMPMDGIPPK